MDYQAILNYFESQAETGKWNSLYDPKNPLSYSFILRLQKALKLAGPFKNKRVLDLGCGTGVLMPFVINDAGQYIGLDVSEKMLSEAKKNYSEYVNSGNASFIYGDIHKMQLPEDLDIIIGLGFIEYFDNPQELVHKLYDKLAKGGFLILSFPNLYSLDYLALQLLRPARYLTRIIFQKPAFILPKKLWCLADAKRLYIKAGFTNLKVINYNVNIFSYPLTKISLPFTNYFARKFEYSLLSKYNIFGTGFLILGEK